MPLNNDQLAWIHNLLVSDQVQLRGSQVGAAVGILDAIREELKPEDEDGDSPDTAE